MRLKKVHFLIIAFLVLLILLGIRFMWLITAGPWSFEYQFDYRFRYRECEPEKLLPDLKEQQDISFPERLKHIKCAHTPGTWDSQRGPFIVRFSAEPNTVDTFIKSFPRKFTFEVYKSEDDEREIPDLRTPQWFTEVIKEGKKAMSPAGDTVLYIDTTNKADYVVYLQGYYGRDANEINEELRKDPVRPVKWWQLFRW